MKKITLTPGNAEGIVPCAKTVDGPMIGLDLKTGKEFNVVPDDSTEDGVSETLAASLVERGLCIYVEDAEAVKVSTKPVKTSPVSPVD